MAHDHDHDTATAEGFEPNVHIEDAGPARKKLTIEVPGDAVRAKLEESFQTLRDEAVIPGFRRGRAPRRLLEKRFGPDVRRETLSQVVGESYSNAIEQHELRPLGEPSIKDMEELDLPEEGPLKFEAEVEIMPEIELPDLKDLEVKKPVIEIGDDRIDSELERYREMYGTIAEVDESQHNDYITADVELRDAEGEVAQELPDTQMLVPGEQRKFKGVVAGIVIEDLGNKLAGKKAGDTLTLEATAPQQHEVEAIREKPVKIDLTIKSVGRHQPMAMEDLVEAAGAENEQELRDQIREQLEQQGQAEQRQAMGSQVVDYLVENVDVELPESVVARHSQQLLQRRAMDMMYRGQSQEDVGAAIGDLQADSEVDAEREVKAMFILEAIARERNLEVSDAEVNGQVVQMAMQQGRRPEKAREEMSKSGQLDQLVIQLREQKAVDALLEEAKPVEISMEDWNKQQEQAEEEAKKLREQRREAKAKEKEKAEADASEEPENKD